MKTQTKNPSTYSYREAIEFIKSQNRKVEEPPPSTRKPPRKSHLRPFQIIVGDERSDFTIQAQTIARAYRKAVKRIGLGHTITVDGGNQTLVGFSEVE